MAQSIKISIAGKDYPVVASTPDRERKIRMAAEEINARLAAFDAKFPNTKVEDKLAFAALNLGVSGIDASEQVASLKKEAERLEGEMASYLERIESNR